MGDGDRPAKQKILGNDTAGNAIVQALRRYFDQPAHGGDGHTVNPSEKLIIRALKSYFNREGWS